MKPEVYTLSAGFETRNNHGMAYHMSAYSYGIDRDGLAVVDDFQSILTLKRLRWSYAFI